jgi:selenide,water dikinase
VAVIGGGVAGAEVAAAFANALAGKGRAARVHLVDRAKVLSALPVSTASRLRKALAGLGVICHENTEIVEITEQAIVTATGRIEAQFICGAAGARPHPWLTETGLTLHEGFIEVNPFLESSTQDIFATGDCAHMAFAPRPKAGVYAVRQAPVLYENLRARLADRTPTQRYSPQKDYLKLISLGEKSALGNKFGLNFQGPWVWRWKDGIDQRFMEKFRDLPVMERPDPPRERSAGVAEALAGKMLCGGCGAKVGQSALMGALGAETPGDDAAALMVDGAQVIISTDHLREMVKDPYVMAEITAHHALGDLWSMGATPVAATANIILPQMKPRLSARSLHEIMTAARAVFGAAGAEIVGGHSSLGAEMTIGFTVLGRRDGPPVTLGGARVGDLLLLTKPIGSGVIMAAEMAGLAEAEWVEAALRQMTRLQRDAAEILRNAHAMTDVTGFGLLGHLRNICVTSEVGAVLRARDVPVMPGALVLAEQGISSSLFEENRLMLPEVSRSPLNDLMFDPQTAGGLLAAVAPEEAGLVEALRAAGHEAALIGEITDEVGRVQLL